MQKLFAQLEELHYGYEGQRILDDIHRGFHTIYGGAAVLALPELAECAQLAEKVLDRLCSRRLPLSPSLVSLIVGVTSAIEAMLARLLSKQEVLPVAEDLRARLLRAASRNGNVASVNRPELPAGDDRLEVFFGGNPPARARVDGASLQASEALSQAPGKADEDPISDQEFENLLDKLYGKGKGPTRYLPPGAAVQQAAVPSSHDTATISPAASGSSPAAGQAEPSEIGDLIRELAWVRNRLVSVQQGVEGENLSKALAYLDLVTKDMERWLASRSSQG